MVLDSSSVTNNSLSISDLADLLVVQTDMVLSSLENVKWKGDAGSAFRDSLHSHCLKLKADADTLREVSFQLARHANAMEDYNIEERVKNSGLYNRM
jgi:uncharacterized protein YukE